MIERVSQAARRLALDQALANARIEGHEPTPEFLADCAAVIAGTMTFGQARSVSLARALAKENAAGSAAPELPAVASVESSTARPAPEPE